MATYYSKHDAGGGGVGSFADPFTLQELFDNTDSGDLGLICNTGTYTPSVTIDIDNGSAVTANNYAVIRGANADGSDDGTIATISGSSLGASTDLFNFNVSAICIKLENLRITGATQYNVTLNAAINASNIIFNNCRIDNATNHGIYNAESTLQFFVGFNGCEIDNNGGDGINSAGFSRGGIKMINTSVHDNTGDGVKDTTGSVAKSVYIGCSFYDNGEHGLNFSDDCFGAVCINCVFFGNTDNGINFTDTTNTCQMTFINNIYRSNGGYGIDTNGGSSGQFALCDYNCFSNNTSGAMDISTPGSNNVTSDPLFTSETDGSEDFTLQSSSPCKNIGIGYNG